MLSAATDNRIEFTPRDSADYTKRRITKDLLFARLLNEIEQSEGRAALASTTANPVESS